ncbi:hypothetical protein COCON_G00080540 [Conger conger]|uniref:Uncharacterized protein n=1 Tax=Conger conger TaxID=82655 RepID=A0A9Q1DPH9_CONCO|nr:hypothetical protein COCON_G00080540 [Conger conger]
MDSAMKSKEETKAFHKQSGSRYQMLSAGCLPTAACFVLSLSSIAICFLTSFKTSQLEHRLYALEMEKRSTLHQSPSVLFEEGTALRETIEKVVQEKIAQAMPKLRASRDVAQECACPPVAFLFRGLATCLRERASESTGPRERQAAALPPRVLHMRAGLLCDWSSGENGGSSAADCPRSSYCNQPQTHRLCTDLQLRIQVRLAPGGVDPTGDWAPAGRQMEPSRELVPTSGKHGDRS